MTEAGLFAKTTVAVISEMGRTPKLNQSNGKDHWPVTSAMLIGPKVRGGRVYGGTDENQLAMTVDMATGQPGAGANITSANFVAGTLQMLGVDPALHLPNTVPLTGFIA